MIDEKEWRKERRDYRHFLEGKKRNNEEWLELIEKDKGMKLFWEAVRINRHKGFKMDETISNEQ